ncbi:MAG TPA: hypothetical protein VLZ83_00810 [Edaphocola sp.]|nr:hypothetical protein [Edaphocola sp.]
MNKTFGFKKWVRFGLLNLFLVALLGLLMRYKIAFDFPFFHQKYLLYAHSNFAFTGWIGYMCYIALTRVLANNIPNLSLAKYKWLIGLNLVGSYGMYISFIAQGYRTISILFSILTILVAIAFAISFINDSRKLPANSASKPWANMAVVLNVLSNLGPLYLGYMMFTKDFHSDLYLAATYYFLHFQYNGWFFFTALALIANYLPKNVPGIDINKYFKLFAWTVLPTFLLSILWAKIPFWLYIISVIAAFIQLFAWIAMVIKNYPILIKRKIVGKHSWINIFIYASLFAMSIKFLLQTVSVIPSLSHMVFGFRPIVIAYLHLVLLGVFTLFVIGYLLMRGWFIPTKNMKLAAFCFLIGVVLNELFLGIQGGAAIFYVPIPYINEFLLLAAVFLFVGAGWMFVSQLIAKDSVATKEASLDRLDK